MNEKLWGGRFKEETAAIVDRFNASIRFDYRLHTYDIQGSIAHARMLVSTKLLTEEEGTLIIKGLEEIGQEITAGTFLFQEKLEDIHMNIEAALTEKIGAVGGKLHTARSRNDQVALDLRLYLRDHVTRIRGLIKRNQAALLELADQYPEAVLPGYTHLQRAQPVLFSHHLLAYFEMLERDQQRMQDLLKRVNVLPLGSGALAGSGLPIDRHFVAEALDFPAITANSLDAVSDRDFALEFLSAASILMMHLSRFCEELVLWSSAEFNFIALSDGFCTGSSMMPQKKNPDIPELVRGKTGRVYGSLVSLLTVMKGLPLAYNKDMQEDKEPVFDAVETITEVLTVMASMIAEITLHDKVTAAAVADGFILATDLSDYLVKKGMPFRESHRVIGTIVAYCLEQQTDPTQLTSKEFQQFSDLFTDDIKEAFGVAASVASKNIPGGTAPEQVKQALIVAKKKCAGS